MGFKKVFSVLTVGTLTVSAMSFAVSAQDIDKGFVKFNDRQFNLVSRSTISIGDNYYEKNGAWDAVRVSDAAKEEGDLWSGIKTIKAEFYIDVTDENFSNAASEISSATTYVQLGEKAGKAHYWAADSEDLTGQFANGFAFGSDHVMTATWNVAGAMKSGGGTSQSGGGVLKFGIRLQNGGYDNLPLKIVWVSVSVDGDKDKIAKYSGSVVSAPVTTPAITSTTPTATTTTTAITTTITQATTTVGATTAATTPAVTTTTAPTTQAPSLNSSVENISLDLAAAEGASTGENPKTGASGIAVAVCAAVLSLGAIAVNAKNKKK